MSQAKCHFMNTLLVTYSVFLASTTIFLPPYLDSSYWVIDSAVIIKIVSCEKKKFYDASAWWDSFYRARMECRNLFKYLGPLFCRKIYFPSFPPDKFINAIHSHQRDLREKKIWVSDWVFLLATSQNFVFLRAKDKNRACRASLIWESYVSNFLSFIGKEWTKGETCLPTIKFYYLHLSLLFLTV